MFLLRGLVIGVIFLSVSNAANAIPVEYEITFDSSVSGYTGTGSFFWDDSIQMLSNITWDFGGGNTGGINDATVDWNASVFGGTKAQFTFEILTAKDVSPANCSESGSGCNTSFESYGYGGDYAQFWIYGDNSQSFRFFNTNLSSTPVAIGALTTNVVGVPEPSSLVLMGLGLAGLSFARRRNQA